MVAPSSAQAPSPRPSTFAEAEGLIKALAGVAVLLYAFGLVTVNTYLYRLGISDFSLLRAKFIYTGGLVCLLPLAVAAAFATMRGMWAISEAGPKVERQPWIRVYFVLFGALPVVFASAGFIDLAHSQGVRTSNALAQAGLGLLSSGSVVLLAFGVWRIVKRLVGPETPERPDETKTLEIMVLAIMLVLFFVSAAWYVDRFARDTYPLVPEAFGGGKPRKAALLFSNEGLSGATQLGIPMVANSQLSQPVTVLYEGENTYALLLADQTVAQVDKKMVLGIRTGK